MWLTFVLFWDRKFTWPLYEHIKKIHQLIRVNMENMETLKSSKKELKN